ncbi:EamA family transporter [Ruminococcaceae bacterium OttesenSCG-928-L11]|nr:EamA family transporter [Ruminococcaceae bacterium OttesenSCG-928-L11]
MWKVFALLSALFAGVTAILAKMGIKGVDSNLATAIRTVVILVMAWGIVFVSGGHKHIGELSKTNWIFLILSGIATGCSWLFYFRAIQMGDVSKVAPIDKMSIVVTMALSFLILGEPVSLKTLGGGLCIVAGTVILLL